MLLHNCLSAKSILPLYQNNEFWCRPCYINVRKYPSCVAASKNSDSVPDPEASSNSNPSVAKSAVPNPKGKGSRKKDEANGVFPPIIPRKPRRGRRSEAVAVEDFIRGSLERTFATIHEQNPEIVQGKESFLKERVEGGNVDSDSNETNDDGSGGRGKEMVVEEETSHWPVDADVGLGIRASEYFEKHPIKNVVGEDGEDIDWEGEIDKGWVQEIDCFEWESFAFRPSPLIVLVFERYRRASDNWKVLKELEKAVQVYWSTPNRLPPRTVKLDINLERDMAYALKVKEGPQILFLRGNRIVYREKAIRTADQLVQMIAHFYYNAKKPSWVDASAMYPPQ